MLRFIRRAVALARMLPTLDLSLGTVRSEVGVETLLAAELSFPSAKSRKRPFRFVFHIHGNVSVALIVVL